MHCKQKSQVIRSIVKTMLGGRKIITTAKMKCVKREGRKEIEKGEREGGASEWQAREEGK